METLTNLKSGDLTDKGIIKMIDTPWLDKDGNPADRIVTTNKGAFRETELTFIPKKEKPVKELKELVDFSTVMSVDIRPGKVFMAKRVPKTDKLLHLVIETALGRKNVVTNLGEKIEPEEFIGKTFLFVMNMNPVTMKGITSEAMILANETIEFVVDENEWVPKVELFKVDANLNSNIL